jgi:Skp family chaperone for outer membrane proteins
MSVWRIVAAVGVLIAVATAAVVTTMYVHTPATTTTTPTPTVQVESLKIAVVDVGKVFREAAAVTSINDQLRPFLEKFRADAAEVEKELRDTQDELARSQATALTADAHTTERLELEQRALEAQNKMLGRKRALDQAQTTAMRQVETTLNNTVAEIFTERKLTLILRRDQTAFFNPSMDITEEVVKRLDQRLPTVEITIPDK